MSHGDLQKRCMDKLKITHPALHEYCINYDYFKTEPKPPIVNKECSTCHYILSIDNFTTNIRTNYTYNRCKRCDKERKKSEKKNRDIYNNAV